jgi:hypothetical protein
MRTMQEIMSETMNEPTNGAPKTAHEAAIAYEAAMSPNAPAETVATSEAPPADDVPTVVDAATTAEVVEQPANELPANAVAADAVSVDDVRRVVEAMSAAKNESLFEGLRLRMKVWIDPTTAKRYLMPSAFMRDVVNGQPVSDVMYAYAMSDEDTKLVTMTAREWNTLPFYYFREDGPAPRMTARPVDVVTPR